MPSLAQLRSQIAVLEGRAESGRSAALSLGVPEIDAALPGGGLAMGGLHEINGATPTVDEGPARGFAAFCLGRLAAAQGKPVLWVVGDDDPYAPGLAGLGLAATRLIVVRAGSHPQWALEEALHCSALAGVVGEVWDLGETAARRLQLAARTSGVTALLLKRGGACGFATTRWRIGTAATPEGIGFRWRIVLSRCRGAAGNDEGWLVEGGWREEGPDEAHRLRLVAVSDDRPALPAGLRRAV